MKTNCKHCKKFVHQQSQIIDKFFQSEVPLKEKDIQSKNRDLSSLTEIIKIQGYNNLYASTDANPFKEVISGFSLLFFKNPIDNSLKTYIDIVNHFHYFICSVGKQDFSAEEILLSCFFYILRMKHFHKASEFHDLVLSMLVIDKARFNFLENSQFLCFYFLSPQDYFIDFVFKLADS